MTRRWGEVLGSWRGWTLEATGRSRQAMIVVLIALAAYDIAYLGVWLARAPQPPFDDFFGLWSFGRFAALSGAAVYDPTALTAFQHALDPRLPGGGYPCPYPPPVLLALAPVGSAPLAPAFVAWVTVTACAYVAATLGGRWRSWTGLALLVTPTSLVTVVAGQNGFLTAALLVGGLRSLKRAPWRAGVLFGLLAYKAQFGLVVPVVLIATRAWRPLLSGAGTAGVAFLAASVAFGWAIWAAWVHGLATYGRLLTANLADLHHAMPTFMANLLGSGAPIGLAAGVQVVVALVALGVVWRTASRAWDERSVATALLATLMVTPYAFTYDLPVLTAALAIEAGRRLRCGDAIDAVDLAAAGLACGVPLAMSRHTIPFVEPALIAVLFARTAWRRTAAPTPTVGLPQEASTLAR